MNRSFSRVLPALALAVALGTSGVAMAQDTNRPKPAFTQDQKAKIVQLYKDFRKDTQEMRTKLYAKRLALDSLARSGNADPKRIEELAGEIAQLRTDIGQKRMEMRETMHKQFGIPEYAPWNFDNRGPGPKDDRRGPGAGQNHKGRPWMMDWEYYTDLTEDFPPMM